MVILGDKKFIYNIFFTYRINGVEHTCNTVVEGDTDDEMFHTFGVELRHRKLNWTDNNISIRYTKSNT